jgi:hypothetical protein
VWTRHDGRVWHAPFGFDGCTVFKRDYTGEVYLGDILIVKYNIEKPDSYGDDMKLVLKNLSSTSMTLNEDIQTFIRNKFKVLIFSYDHKDLINPKTRLKIFQDFYSPYGITIDSVDML